MMAKIDDVMQPVTSQVRHMEATNRETSSFKHEGFLQMTGSRRKEDNIKVPLH